MRWRNCVGLPWPNSMEGAPYGEVVIWAIQKNMFQGLWSLTVVAVPGIRFIDGELVVGEASLARSGLSQQRGVLLIQRAIDVRCGVARYRVYLAELIAGLTAKLLVVPDLLDSGGAALFHGRTQPLVVDKDAADRCLEPPGGAQREAFISGTSSAGTHLVARLARLSIYSLPGRPT